LKFINVLREFSGPLLIGVVAGLLFANINEHAYHAVVEYPILGQGLKLFGVPINLHFLINDVFMVLFFGIAAKEITESMLPGGALNPLKKAVNPLMATLGGVLGPALTYIGLTFLLYKGESPERFSTILGGWGIPTATDIALAWLAARLVFGNGHPAINFLLLLAVADDGIGLAIIAVFYPNPEFPVEPQWLGLTAAGMALAFALRRFKVRSWVPYVALSGVLSWFGLLLAHLHPALALVFIVPFMPAGKRDEGLFVEQETPDETPAPEFRSTLRDFEHQFKLLVDLGLFFFAFANAGVAFSSINNVTWIVFLSLFLGKTIGVFGLGSLASLLGFPLPTGMSKRHLFTAGIVAGMGLTVALFVSGEAFPGNDPIAQTFQGPAKMGAVFSAFNALIAFGVGYLLKAKVLDKSTPDAPSDSSTNPSA
jgi:NhaA family Na+:H+ antiporter